MAKEKKQEEIVKTEEEKKLEQLKNELQARLQQYIKLNEVFEKNINVNKLK